MNKRSNDREIAIIGPYPPPYGGISVHIQRVLSSFCSVLVSPPHVIAKKALQKTVRLAKDIYFRDRDKKLPTYFQKDIKGGFCSYFPNPEIEQLLTNAEAITGVTLHYLDHRFDLLGSGWVKVRHEMRCRGLEGYRYEMGGSIHTDLEGRWLEGRINRANLEESKRIWKLIFHNEPKPSNLKPKTYIPIDWHLDFKSGYRWSEFTWYKDISFGHKSGVDIKVPWELARMQHLPQIAFAYALAIQNVKDKRQVLKSGNSSIHMACAKEGYTKNQRDEGCFHSVELLAAPDHYKIEFRNQLLDFIATNPPRFGVNWRCAMDVAIRVANWLVAYDLFRAYGANFDSEFETTFTRSVYEHGLNIINNLEWARGQRGNHYFSDILGLLFVASYLPRTSEVDAWLAFAVQELVNEIKFQFYPDGANFEASTSYHRLSAEMAIYGTALVLGLPDEKVKALKDYDHKLIKGKPSLSPAPIPFYPLPIKNDSISKGLDRCNGKHGSLKQDSSFESPFPQWYFERLEKMAEFTMHITKQNNHIPQIGDNDSGRFLKLQSVYRKITVAEAKACYANLEGYTDLPDDAIYWDEDYLDHRYLVAANNGLFGREDFTAFTGDGWMETEVVRRLAKNIRLTSYCQHDGLTEAEQVRRGTEKARNCYQSQHLGYKQKGDKFHLGHSGMSRFAPIRSNNQSFHLRVGVDQNDDQSRQEKWEESCSGLKSLPDEQKQSLKIPIPGDDIREGLKLYAYPDFGLYIYRANRLYLAIRCGSIGQNGKGGHAHNDQLSIELNVDGKGWFTDPGTYLYTPLPERRNEYRSVKAHFAPHMAGLEPGRLNKGLFCLGNEVRSECLYFGPDAFVGRYLSHGIEVRCYIYLHKNSLKILNTSSKKKRFELPENYEFFLNNNGDFVFKKNFYQRRFYSHSYGKVSFG